MSSSRAIAGRTSAVGQLLADAQGERPARLGDYFGAISGRGGRRLFKAVAEIGAGEFYAEQVFVVKEGYLRDDTTRRRAGRAAFSGRRALVAIIDYSNFVYLPASSNNYTPANRPYSNLIDKIIIHVAQGTWSSAVNWFQNPYAEVSAHYTVRSSDGFAAQSVREKDIAWHAGNWSYNQTSVGIEHEGYVDDPKWFTEALYDSSARVSAYLCNKYLIPVDRDHIIGHAEVPYPNDHYDPGSNWDWYKYMDYVSYYPAIG